MMMMRVWLSNTTKRIRSQVSIKVIPLHGRFLLESHPFSQDNMAGLFR